VKLAFVIQRYGADIAGGSETHCRQLAERLSGRHDITILTTCARDYVTWQNAYPAGASTDGRLRVVRFPTAHTRRLKRFADLSDEVFAGGASSERQEEWFRENGPEVPALIDHLRRDSLSYDLVLFWAYRYYPTYFGLPCVHDRAILVPTAEEDLAIDLSVLETFFLQPAGYLFLTSEEETLVSMRAGRPLHPSAVIGIGLDPAARLVEADLQVRLNRLEIPPNYVLYLGRVDRNKGCETLIEYFQEYAASGGDATLVLAGPAKMRVPPHPQIRCLGYVSNDVWHALLGHARLLVVPSPYESLSIVLLEAWNMGVPALVNARCKVLLGQVMRADGGLAYRSALEFREGLEALLSRSEMRDTLGRQGLAYVEREYRWPTVIGRVEKLLTEVQLAKSLARRV
jgi:glycosyltransferase involved in cell wall biosynthesis